MKLKKRVAKIGSSINTRTEKHGDEDVPAIDIPLSSIMLTGKELGRLLRQESAAEDWFTKNSDGLKEPKYKNIKSISLDGKFEESTLTLFVGLNENEIVFSDIKFSKLKLSPQTGGLTQLSLTAQCTPELDESVITLLSFLNHDCSAELVLGKLAIGNDRQKELALNDDEDDAEESGEDAKAPRSRKSSNGEHPAAN
jgi:hypothetical protein